MLTCKNSDSCSLSGTECSTVCNMITEESSAHVVNHSLYTASVSVKLLAKVICFTFGVKGQGHHGITLDGYIQ